MLGPVHANSKYQMPSPYGGGPAPIAFQIPSANSGRGNTLKVGHGVNVYWDLQPPNRWPETQYTSALFMIALDQVVADVAWHSGKEQFRTTSTTRHVLFLPPNSRHRVEWHSTGALLMVFVEANLLREESQRELTQGALVPLAHFVQQDYLLNRTCRRFHDLCHQRRSISDSVALAEGTLVFAGLVHAGIDRFVASVGPHAKSGLPAAKLDKVAEFVDSHLRDNLTPAMLAEVVGISEHHFSRIFRRATGCTPMKYVWRCRLLRARQLLETGQWKVAAAAAETGFCDQSHLDRQFRIEFDCTPGSVIPTASRQLLSGPSIDSSAPPLQ